MRDRLIPAVAGRRCPKESSEPMKPEMSVWMRAPYAAPNGIEATEEGLWVVDQFTDRTALLEWGTPHEYGCTRILREIPTESSTTSGLSYGGGCLWLTANGPGDRWRLRRPTDAESGEIFQVDPATGQTLKRFPLPGGGGSHGLEYDHFDAETIWLTTLKSQTLTQVGIADWSIRHTLPLPYPSGHGVVRDAQTLWVVFKPERAIVRLDVRDGTLLDEIRIEEGMPEPHCLTRQGPDLLYCDASTGWIVRIRDVPA